MRDFAKDCEVLGQGLCASDTSTDAWSEVSNFYIESASQGLYLQPGEMPDSNDSELMGYTTHFAYPSINGASNKRKAATMLATTQ